MGKTIALRVATAQAGLARRQGQSPAEYGGSIAGPSPAGRQHVWRKKCTHASKPRGAAVGGMHAMIGCGLVTRGRREPIGRGLAAGKATLYLRKLQCLSNDVNDVSHGLPTSNQEELAEAA
jgi:hypothetical protein